jgi:hypothetical protein
MQIDATVHAAFLLAIVYLTNPKPQIALELHWLGASRVPFVNSSAISRTEWDNGTLSIWFHESGRYDHYGLPEHVYHAFLAARSKGEFFNDHIRDRY